MHLKWSQKNNEIPILPLRDIIIYPNMIVPLFVIRKKSIFCLKLSMKQNKKIMLVMQKNPFDNDPNIKNLYKIGTLSHILQMLKLPDGTIKILVEGIQRAKIIEIQDKGKYFIGIIKKIKIKEINSKKNNILVKIIINKFKYYIQLNKKIPIEILNSLNNINNIEKFTNTISTHLPIKIKNKQHILELLNIYKRLKYILLMIESEIRILKIEKKIKNRIKKQIKKNQKEYYLNEKIKAIQKELNYINKNLNEYDLIKKKINKFKIPKKIKKKIKLELKKLKIMPLLSSESTVIRNYIDWIIQIPWYKKTKTKKNLYEAKKILDKDHFGLEHIKERILEYLSVQNRSNKIKGPILCFVGPPGVGKTSLGKSIAKATGRKYIRISLGGVKDEAEIRGHRRTYIGSMPGKIMQKIIKSKVKNPLFLLDEIDKISSDLRGDPSSALLEVLDPEQNSYFNDHYIELDYNLSKIMFIATANSINNIPIPLLDRMEVIKLYSYSENEKINIAKKYLIPKQIKNNFLKKKEIKINNNVIIDIIRYYTKESGVRSLEREISKICRKGVKKITINKKIKNIKINKRNIKKYLGIKKFSFKKIYKKKKIGEVTGLAWTENGGEILTIETLCTPGKGKLIYTGSLGKIMKESIQIALTIIKSLYKKLKIKKNFYLKKDIHLHIPEGAVPKDGPSAGITICTSMISTLIKSYVKKNIAMTGEITLHGNILPIGGLKEKILAASRSGIKNIIIPYGNKKNLEEIPINIKKKLKIYCLKNIKEVLKLSLKKKIF